MVVVWGLMIGWLCYIKLDWSRSMIAYALISFDTRVHCHPSYIDVGYTNYWKLLCKRENFMCRCLTLWRVLKTCLLFKVSPFWCEDMASASTQMSFNKDIETNSCFLKFKVTKCSSFSSMYEPRWVEFTLLCLSKYLSHPRITITKKTVLSSKLCHPLANRTTALTVRTGVGVGVVSRMPRMAINDKLMKWWFIIQD